MTAVIGSASRAAAEAVSARLTPDFGSTAAAAAFVTRGGPALAQVAVEAVVVPPTTVDTTPGLALASQLAASTAPDTVTRADVTALVLGTAAATAAATALVHLLACLICLAWYQRRRRAATPACSPNRQSTRRSFH